jgi:hypothetical protein
MPQPTPPSLPLPIYSGCRCGPNPAGCWRKKWSCLARKAGRGAFQALPPICSGGHPCLPYPTASCRPATNRIHVMTSLSHQATRLASSAEPAGRAKPGDTTARNGCRYGYSSRMRWWKVLRNSSFHLRDFAVNVFGKCRCGEMADAQDLKFEKWPFLVVSRDFSPHK